MRRLRTGLDSGYRRVVGAASSSLLGDATTHCPKLEAHPCASISTAATAVVIALSLAACQTPAVKDRIVEVDKPIAVQPIAAKDVPALPKPLPPRPSSLSAAADTLLSKVCEWVSYGLRADPLLKVSAGEKQIPAAAYPECEGR